MSDVAKRKGELVARALIGSWRKQPPPLELTPIELEEVAPLLYGSGAAGLAWKRLKSSQLKEHPSATVLHQGYRLLWLESVIQEQRIAKVFRVLRGASVEPILAKGWSAARVYPDSALRPHGDIDLLVRPSEFQRALDAARAPELLACSVDLHARFFELDDRAEEELFARSVELTLESEAVRVLSAEDQLALLAIHLLKHGAWRPLWLCDIAAAIEYRAPQFAWDICLGKSEKRARWIMTAIGLARLLLNADVSSAPISPDSIRVPKWLVDSVLREWATPFPSSQPPLNHSAPLATYFRQPSGMFKALRERWPNPILATVSINGDFNDLPRLPYQVGNCALRAGQFLWELPTRFRNSVSSASVSGEESGFPVH